MGVLDTWSLDTLSRCWQLGALEQERGRRSVYGRVEGPGASVSLGLESEETLVSRVLPGPAVPLLLALASDAS